jgi:pilus assembly protein CpaF
MLDLQSNILGGSARSSTSTRSDRAPPRRSWQARERATIDLVETWTAASCRSTSIRRAHQETLNEALALGPEDCSPTRDRRDRSSIADRVVVGKEGGSPRIGQAFSSDDVFERVVSGSLPGGLHRRDAPVVDLRMRDGDWLTAAVVTGRRAAPALLRRRRPDAAARRRGRPARDVLGMANFLATCVTARRNILVCGGPGSGKTRIVAALAAASPPGERVISVEEIAEIAIARDEWIQLESRVGGKNRSISRPLETSACARSAGRGRGPGRGRCRSSVHVHRWRDRAMTGEGAAG